MCCLPVIHSGKIAHPSASSLAPAHMLYLSSSLVHHTPYALVSTTQERAQDASPGYIMQQD
jgi:hypothetical protein